MNKTKGLYRRQECGKKVVVGLHQKMHTDMLGSEKLPPRVIVFQVTLFVFSLTKKHVVLRPPIRRETGSGTFTSN